MATGISWTDETWNPTVGCSKKSEGCRNCYAIGQSHRNAAIGATMPNPGRLKYYEGLTEKRGDRVEWTGVVNFVPEALEIPLRWKKPRRIFVNSMSDLFHESVTFGWIDKAWEIMKATPRHTYQILTKRPDRMVEYAKSNQTLPNVLLGVTVENQQAANDRIPLLLQCPAALRFLSCEPLIAPVWVAPYVNCLDWVIIGGESGPGARGCDLAWIDAIAQNCVDKNVPVFVKQLGAKPYQVYDRILGKTITWPISDRKGAIVAEFPDYLQVQQFPEVS